MKAKIVSIASAALLFAAAGWAGDEVAAGKAAFEANCGECHYEDDFAGETKEDIAALIKGVVDGKVEHQGDAGELTDEDIAALAAYFASFE